MRVKTLIIDIETSPNVAHVWSLWKQNVSLSQLRESSFVLCWAAKWVGEKKVHFRDHRDPEMIPTIRDLLDEADAVVHYNGTSFDIPTLNQEIAKRRLTRPAKAKDIDLLRVVRSQFNLPSNKLDYVLKYFNLPGKTGGVNHDLWVGVLNDDDTAWRKMKQYNINDVRALEPLYTDVLRPWIDTMPNQQLYVDDPDGACPRCGVAGKLTRDGHRYTQMGRYQRYYCHSCGGRSSESRRDRGATLRSAA